MLFRSEFGPAWEISTNESPLRVHPSAQGAIRTLAALLAPNKAAGRVLFAAEGGDQA